MPSLPRFDVRVLPTKCIHGMQQMMVSLLPISQNTSANVQNLLLHQWHCTFCSMQASRNRKLDGHVSLVSSWRHLRTALEELGIKLFDVHVFTVSMWRHVQVDGGGCGAYRDVKAPGFPPKPPENHSHSCRCGCCSRSGIGTLLCQTHRCWQHHQRQAVHLVLHSPTGELNTNPYASLKDHSIRDQCAHASPLAASLSINRSTGTTFSLCVKAKVLSVDADHMHCP